MTECYWGVRGENSGITCRFNLMPSLEIIHDLHNFTCWSWIEKCSNKFFFIPQIGRKYQMNCRFLNKSLTLFFHTWFSFVLFSCRIKTDFFFNRMTQKKTTFLLLNLNLPDWSSLMRSEVQINRIRDLKQKQNRLRRRVNAWRALCSKFYLFGVSSRVLAFVEKCRRASTSCKTRMLHTTPPRCWSLSFLIMLSCTHKAQPADADPL